jgi:hypothetical protein
MGMPHGVRVEWKLGGVLFDFFRKFLILLYYFLIIVNFVTVFCAGRTYRENFPESSENILSTRKNTEDAAGEYSGGVSVISQAETQFVARLYLAVREKDP